MSIISSVYISSSHDPFYNLALENELLLSIKKDEKVVLVYSNRPCIVYGRFQNPWIECDIEKVLSSKVELVRRQSGGGCVYHDLENLNFCFIHGDRDYNGDDNNKILLEVLKLFGVEAIISKRSDLHVRVEGSLCKISGSAFKQKKDSSFHHCTMLLNSNLSILDKLLKSPLKSLKSKSIKSNPSPVVNLSQLNPKITKNNFIDKFCETLKKYRDISVMGITLKDKNYFNTITNPTWVYGETPLFEFELVEQKWPVSFRIKKGIIESIDIDCRIEKRELFLQMRGLNIFNGELLAFLESLESNFMSLELKEALVKKLSLAIFKSD